MTNLKLYYLKLDTVQKKQFKESVMQRVGISESSFYRFLDQIPNVLVKEVIADISKINSKELYQTK